MRTKRNLQVPIEKFESVYSEIKERLYQADQLSDEDFKLYVEKFILIDSLGLLPPCVAGDVLSRAYSVHYNR